MQNQKVPSLLLGLVQADLLLSGVAKPEGLLEVCCWEVCC